jgi:hypothetical protein
VSASVTPRVTRRRRAALVFAGVVLALAIVLVVRAAAGGGATAGFVGAWEGSDPTLGSTTLRIAQTSAGAAYTVQGLRPAGHDVTSLRTGDDGTLTASGTAANGDWRVQLTLAADDRQLLAEYTPPGAGASTTLRFTRAP